MTPLPRSRRSGESPFGAAATRRSRVRSWPGAGRAGSLAAQRRAEMADLQQGVRYHRLFRGMIGFIVALSAIVVLLGSAGMIVETRSRPLTPAEQYRYQQEEIAQRWQAWPAAGVFPEEVKYMGLERAPQYARRIGIAPQSTCAQGLDVTVADVLGRHGCVALLRATYMDESATFVFTVGVAVLQSEESRVSANEELSADDRVGVLPVPFPGTVAERFGVEQRQRNGWVGAGPYIVFSTGGYADGRTRESIPPEEILHSELWPAAKSIGNQIAYFLADPPSVPPCTQGNVC
ncbi:MAG: hypothetical protein HOV86_17580 [Thermoactinospora sp.]|nr:hypothetical protein [Thermoactinospora sp.]